MLQEDMEVDIPNSTIGRRNRENDVWEVVPRLTDRVVIGSHWIYKIKHDADGSIEKYTVRIVAKGFSWKEGIDYEETFSLVATYTSIRAMISLATEMGWQSHQMDVKTMFLNGELEEVYIEQPEGFVAHNRETHMCRLKRALYGSSRLPRSGSLGLMNYFLGMEAWQTDGEIFLGQGIYCIEILRRFMMEDCRAMSTPMISNWRKIETSREKDVDPTLYKQLIGSRMYLFNTRPNISYSVNSLSYFVMEPKRVHWMATKPVLRYLRDTIEYGIKYARGDGLRLVGYTDADWAGNTMDWKSTLGCCFSKGSGVVFVEVSEST
eukprot:PITA_32409